MAVSALQCPNCGYNLPTNTKANQLVQCPACKATFYISDWQVGDPRSELAVATPTRVYRVRDLLAKDDLCNVYRCAYTADGQPWQGLFRIARASDDNDLVQNEARILHHFQATSDYDEFRAFLPQALESFLYRDASLDAPRQVNIVSLHTHIEAPDELYTLEEVRGHYTGGIHPKDMAWMWRRLLHVMGYAHRQGVIHGAVLPQYVLIEPRDHKLALTGWGFAARNGARLRAISVPYESWYPPELSEGTPPTPAFDICMGARCMMYLIDAAPDDLAAHPGLEQPLQTYFARCLDANPQRRFNDAWAALADFDRVIESQWGPRSFRVFTMPRKSL